MIRRITLNTLVLLMCMIGGGVSIQAQVVINEFSAANYASFTDGFGEENDWIELYNMGSDPVDLGGYYLSDRHNNPDKWEIPAGVTIAANGYLVFWASGLDINDGSAWHTNFKITQTRNKEDVILADPSGNIIDFHLIDDAVQEGHSWARKQDGSGDWGVALNPSLGTSNQDVKSYYTSKAAILPEAGFYTGSVEVTLESDHAGVQMYYTLDGSTPTTASTLYTAPFTLTQTTVVKTLSVNPDSDLPNSFVDYHTFFVDETHTIPVVSISGDEVLDLLDGNGWLEPIGTFEYFDETGERVADATGDFNKHGNDSWAYPQRGLDYITRDQFGDDYAIKHEIFDENITDRKKFQRLILKAAANDNYPFEDGAHIRDAYVHTLSQRAKLNMDERTSQACILYANGEYWGVYDIREKVDDHDFTSYYYDHDEEDIDFIKTWGGTWNEYGNGMGEWNDLLNYIATNDMSVDANYDYVTERLDVLSLIDYMVLHSHNVSADWLNWNTGWWRGRNPDGADIAKRWRYILWDEDATFGHYINYTGVPDETATADPCNPEFITSDPMGHVDNFVKLQENPEFFQLYISRYAELNTTYFSCEYMLALLDEMIGEITPEMPRQIDRWGGTMDGWQASVQQLRDFIETRCTIISDGLVDCYDDELDGPYLVTVNVEPPGAGTIMANTLEGITYPWNMEFFGGLDLNLTAIAQGGSTFSHWEVANNTFGPDAASEAINMSLETGDIITAFFTGYSPCAAPENVMIEPDLTSADITWEANPDAIGYIIKYRKQGDTGPWEEESSGAGSGKVINGLDVCTEYDLVIQAVCDIDLGLELQYTFTTECFTATEDAEHPIGFASTYPNPFEDFLNVDLFVHKMQDARLELVSVDGKVVRQQYLGTLTSGVHKFTLENLGDIHSGFYLVRITGEGYTAVQKIVKY